MLAEPWCVRERPAYLFQPVREKGKEEMTRACCRPESEETQRPIVTVSWKSMEIRPMKGKRRKKCEGEG